MEEMEIKKVILSFTVDKEADKAETTIMGDGVDLLCAYVEVSKALLKKIEELGGEKLARGFYATAQKAVIDGSCLKRSYDEHVEQFERVRPLMDILGKTFEAPKKEGEE